LYREIVAHHPGFAPAYSSLAQLQNTVHFVHPGVFRSAHAAGEALSLASEATRLDPIDSRAQLCLGWANAMSGRFDEAAVHHRLACELNENDPWTLVSSALGFAFRGEPKEALSLADHALELSPSPNGTHWRYQAMIRYMCQDFPGSVSAAEQAESSIQNVYVWKAAALHALGRDEEAASAAVRFFEAVEKRWFGPEVPSRRLMTRWILHGFPIMRTEDFERLREDFGGAGAPVEEIDHNSW
jgi:tetratricopeptide (TPR) repeat protein